MYNFGFYEVKIRRKPSFKTGDDDGKGADNNNKNNDSNKRRKEKKEIKQQKKNVRPVSPIPLC